jgi:hypothetical protein
MLSWWMSRCMCSWDTLIVGLEGGCFNWLDDTKDISVRETHILMQNVPLHFLAR